MYASIALLSQPYSTLAYSLPKAFPANFWQPGLRVAVPLGKGARSIRAGCLLETREDSGLPAGTPCKTIIFPMETRPLLNDALMELADELAKRQGLTCGGILGRVLPQGLRSTGVKIKWLPKQRSFSLPEAGELPADEFERLAGALISGEASFSISVQDDAAMEICSLRVDPPWPVRPAAKKQMEILDFLNDRGMASRRMLLASLGQAAARPLKSLVEAGHVAISRGMEDEEIETALLAPAPDKIILNPDQAYALGELRAALASSGAQSRLLYGVTGSGKTAVYLELVKECLDSGKSVMLLAPEVALAHKLYMDARGVFPVSRIVLYHGYQHPARREATFRELAEKPSPRLIIGTRSALFLPVSNLGCIILDEEHDSSFKQEERVAYHAKEVAWFRMEQNRGLLLLASATPDIRTFYAAGNGALPMLRLPRRVGNAHMPPVEILDIGPQSGLPMDSGLEAGGAGILAPACENALEECLRKNEQAVILLNRRGYAPLVYCVQCGRTLRCPHCEIGLNYHKSVKRLICHYCNYSMPFPAPCPTCGSMNYMALGEGTEKLSEKLEAIAGRPILRLDRDNARRQGKIEEILGSFARGESPFLVGTQMLSKGHHFPNVTLVIVADGDIGLNLPDYRAAERTFQLLAQSAGRAGRGDKPGKVLIQTRDAGHYFWRYVTNYDYEGFYGDELARRRKMLYPPFTRLGLLRVTIPMEYGDGTRAIAQLGAYLREAAPKLDIRLLGPAPAPIAMLRGKKRFHCLLKCRNWQSARQLYFLAREFKPAARLGMFLDLDPVNML